jgi:hypothetical protein
MNRRIWRPQPCDRIGDQLPENITRQGGQKELLRPPERSLERFQNQVLCLEPLDNRFHLWLETGTVSAHFNISVNSVSKTVAREKALAKKHDYFLT